MTNNPVLESINSLKEKELVSLDGTHYPLGMVKIEDAIQALEELELKLLAHCQAEVARVAAGMSPNFPLIFY